MTHAPRRRFLFRFALSCTVCDMTRTLPLRPITIDGDIARVPISDTQEAIIDIADLHLVEGKRWTRTRPTGPCYAVTRHRYDGQVKPALLHRLILDAPPGYFVDHIDRDRLNNRRANLRLCNPTVNAINRSSAPNKTGFRGVWQHGRGYYASICVNRKKVHIGPFSTAELAAAAYTGAATVVHGEVANIVLL